jgi:Putative amidoligase enzyme
MYTKNHTLDDLLRNHIALQNGAEKADVFGVEVELEGKKIAEAGPDCELFWKQVPDGSLRKLVAGAQATEYVFRTPFDMVQTEKAIHLLFTYLTTPPAEVFDSYRTSIHIHVNYGQETFRTIYNAMVLTMILDELLVSQNGEHRVGNNFCLRSKDAMGQIVSLIHSVDTGHEFFAVSPADRYCSWNPASLVKYGSIEYRSLECTTHEGRVMHWIGTLQRIKEAARNYKNPTEIIQQFSRAAAAEHFLSEVLGPFALKYKKVVGFEEMLRNGMRIAQDLAYCSEWNEKRSSRAERVKEDF